MFFLLYLPPPRHPTPTQSHAGLRVHLDRVLGLPQQTPRGDQGLAGAGRQHGVCWRLHRRPPHRRPPTTSSIIPVPTAGCPRSAGEANPTPPHRTATPQRRNDEVHGRSTTVVQKGGASSEPAHAHTAPLSDPSSLLYLFSLVVSLDRPPCQVTSHAQQPSWCSVRQRCVLLLLDHRCCYCLIADST